MNWNSLLRLKAWLPLKSISSPIFHHLGDGLYQLADNVFVVAQSYDQNFVEGSPDAPFITLLYWAANIEAAKRSALQEIQFDSFPVIDPPSELLLGTDGTYGGLVGIANSSSERAVYKGTDGSFVHKVIAINNYSYFFLDTDIDHSQKPYAIEIGLSG